jgi:hypothetical protein
MPTTTATAAAKETILLYTGESRYSVQNQFVADLAAALESLGYHAPVFDFRQPDHVAQFQGLVPSGRVLGSFCINDLWSHGVRTVAGYDVFDEHGIPNTAWFGDPPFTYLYKRIVEHPAKDHLFFGDEQWVTLYQELFPTPQHSASFLQIAGSRLNTDPPKPMAQRTYPLVFFGSFAGPPEYFWQQLEKGLYYTTLPKQRILQLVQDHLEWYLADYSYHHQTDFSLSFLRGLQGLGLEITNPQLLGQITYITSAVDLYLRTTRRDAVIRAIKHTPLHIFGEGWELFHTDQTNLVIHDRVPFMETHGLVADSQMALSLNILTAGSAHCRVPYIMAHHTPLLTEQVDWINRHLEPNAGGCVAFPFAPGVDIDAVVNDALADPVALEAMAHRGYELFEQHLSWTCFARNLVAHFQQQPAPAPTLQGVG